MWSGTNWRSYTGGTALIATFAFFQFISLGAFAKLRKATVRLIMSFCMSVRPSAWNISLPLNGFSLNLIFECFFFKKNLSRKVKFL